MSRTTLVLVHGRAQAGKDPAALKAIWLAALRLGLGRERSKVLDSLEIVFPFYGDLLDGFARDHDASIPADIMVRGGPLPSAPYRDFLGEIVEDVGRQLNVGEPQVEMFLRDEVRARGALNWEWVQALLRAADAIPGVSAASIERATRDVYLYLSVSRIRRAVNALVADAIPAGPTVVLAHSLGTVVAYDVLRGGSMARRIPLLMTVGSPLGVGPIRRVLAPLAHPAGVDAWYNAFDQRDVVSLHALDAATFAVEPPIENYDRVRNGTPNAHGIEGYLCDATVAARLHRALSSGG